jgi:hypothetical protein
MKRSLTLVVVVVAMAGAVLSGFASLGCGDKGAEPSPTPPELKVTTPPVGTDHLSAFIPRAAASFSDGLGVVGLLDKPGEPIISTVMRPLDLGSWSMAAIGDQARFPRAATDHGSTQVVVGQNESTGPPGSPEVPFVAVGNEGVQGAFQVQDVGESLFGGKSAEIIGLGRTGDPGDPATQFIMVGGTVSSQNGEIGNPTGTVPFAFTSPDGNDWQPTADLPLPDGVTGAAAVAVTYAPDGTAYPGVVVVGTGWTDEAQRRTVGIVWHSSDEGGTWDIVSDDSFDEAGRNLGPMFVAADSDTIVVAGIANLPGGSGEDGQYAAMDWTIGSDGSVERAIDSLDPGRSSETTALIARPDGGFLTATQLYDVGSAPTHAGDAPTGDPVARAWSSVDGYAWTDQTASVPDLESALVISGIGESGGRVAFYGVDTLTLANVYVVDAATLE